MTTTEGRGNALTCRRCSVLVDLCAFCEREDCPETICYRCLRIELTLLMSEPHVHGG